MGHDGESNSDDGMESVQLTFDMDILFRNGSLALVWLAGNDEFKTKKGRRNKQYQEAVKANIIALCTNMRTLFPTMGTAHGLGLKKMGTLMKGIGVIYSIKVDDFARTVYETILVLTKPVVLGDPHIDVALGSKKTNQISKKAAAVPEEDNDKFGELHVTLRGDHFGDFNTEMENENFFGTPRAVTRYGAADEGIRVPPFRMQVSPPESVAGGDQIQNQNRERRKRKREEEETYQDVLEKLRQEAEMNPRAHCLPEDELLPTTRDDIQPEFDFGGDLNLEDAAALRAFGPAEQLDENAMPPPPPSNIESFAGPPSTVDHESRSKAMETPVGAGTEPANGRKRRGTEREADTTALELEEIQPDRLKRRRLLTRRRLVIDENICISTKEMKARISSITAEVDYDALQSLIEVSRATGKSHWTKELRGLSCISSSGRQCGRILREMSDDILKACQRKREQVRAGRDDTSDHAGISGGASLVQLGVGRSDIGSPSALTINKELDTVNLEPQEEIPMPQPSPPRQEEEIFNNEQEYGYPDYPAAPSVVADVLSPQRTKRQRREEKRDVLTEEVANRMDGMKFHEMYPPSGASRKKAAMAFFALLKMQAKKEVHLHQNMPYGPITIKRLQAMAS